jgi:hypothetical protein
MEGKVVLGQIFYENFSFPCQSFHRLFHTQHPPSSVVGTIGQIQDLTPLDILLWGLFKDRVFVSPLSANVVELGTRIITSVAEVKPEMLRSVWQEIYYRWDVFHITSGSHIEL